MVESIEVLKGLKEATALASKVGNENVTTSYQYDVVEIDDALAEALIALEREDVLKRIREEAERLRSMGGEATDIRLSTLIKYMDEQITESEK